MQAYIQHKHDEIQGFKRIATEFFIDEDDLSEHINILLNDTVSGLEGINIVTGFNFRSINPNNRVQMIADFVRGTAITKYTNEKHVPVLIDPEFDIINRLIAAAPAIIDAILARKEEHGNGYFSGAICTW